MAAAAIEDVIADLGGLHQRRSPVWTHRDGVIIGGAAGGVAKRRFAGEDLRRKLLGSLPGGRLARTMEVAIAGERELAAAMAGALIDHGADGMAIMARVHAVKHHFSDRLLTPAAFAAGLVIQGLGQSAMLGDQLGQHHVLGALRCRRGSRHGWNIRAIAHGGAKRGADSGQNNGQGCEQHAVRP